MLLTLLHMMSLIYKWSNTGQNMHASDSLNLHWNWDIYLCIKTKRQSHKRWNYSIINAEVFLMTQKFPLVCKGTADFWPPRLHHCRLTCKCCKGVQRAGCQWLLKNRLSLQLCSLRLSTHYAPTIIFLQAAQWQRRLSTCLLRKPMSVGRRSKKRRSRTPKGQMLKARDRLKWDQPPAVPRRMKPQEIPLRQIRSRQRRGKICCNKWLNESQQAKVSRTNQE